MIPRNIEKLISEAKRHNSSTTLRSPSIRAGGIAQRLKVLAAKSDSLSSIPKTFRVEGEEIQAVLSILTSSFQR